MFVNFQKASIEQLRVSWLCVYPDFLVAFEFLYLNSKIQLSFINVYAEKTSSNI